MAPTPSEWMAKQTPEQRAICAAIQAVVHQAVPGIQEAVAWNHLMFTLDGSTGYTKCVCSIGTHTAHVRVQFFAGTSLADPKGLLEGTGAEGRHFKLSTLKELPKTQLKAWCKESVQVLESRLALKKKR